MQIVPPSEKSFPDQQLVIDELKRELDVREKEIKAFSYAVAHDLQTPLRGIDGYISLFIQQYTDQLDEHGKRLLTKVNENVIKMQDQLRDLDFLLQLGTVTLHLSEIDMRALATEAAESLRVDHIVQMTIEENTLVLADATLMKEALIRLISNAMKFSPKQMQSKIEIGSIRQGADLHFFVRDFGVGFDETYKETLFDIFQRLHDPELYPGTGLGLAIVKQIIVRHDGQVWATGKENEGATFYFSIPTTTPTDESR